jgi:hypothetical protein
MKSTTTEITTKNAIKYLLEKPESTVKLALFLKLPSNDPEPDLLLLSLVPLVKSSLSSFSSSLYSVIKKIYNTDSS